MQKEIISIIGFGTIGKAIKNFFDTDRVDFLLNDPILPQSDPYFLITTKSTIIFICVSAPTLENGAVCLENVLVTLNSLNIIAIKESINPLICIKTTLLPDQLEILKKQFNQLRICFTPEYARNEHATSDLFNIKSLVIGGAEADAKQIDIFYRKFGKANNKFRTSIVDIKSASLLKYMENSFLATKLSFLNQFYELYQSLNIDDTWDHLMEAFHQDPRMGNSHFLVPGPDNKRGWGGKCFPKDIDAIINFSTLNYKELSIMSHVKEYNSQIREIDRFDKNSDYCGKDVNLKLTISANN